MKAWFYRTLATALWHVGAHHLSFQCWIKAIDLRMPELKSRIDKLVEERPFKLVDMHDEELTMSDSTDIVFPRHKYDVN